MRFRKAGFAVKILMLASQCVLLLLLAGCWNNRDLTELNIVTGIGIDKSENGKVLFTAQVVEPAAIQSTSSGRGKGGEAQPSPIFVESYEGDTVFEAIRGMLALLDKKLFFSTAQILVIGEALAQDGIYEVLDFFQRDHELSYDMDVIVTRNCTAREILETEFDMEPIAAMFIKESVENTSARAKVKHTILIDLAKDMSDRCKQTVLGQIEKIGEKEIKTEGAAVFRDGKMVGRLDQFETRGYMFATGQVESTIVNIPADGSIIAAEITRTNGKVKAEIENGNQAVLKVQVKVDANVGEYKGKGVINSQEVMERLQEALGEEIKKEILMAVEKAQKEFASDIFGFGTYLHKFHPEYWNKVKDDWNDIFSKLPVDIKVDAKLRRTGIIKGTIRSQ